MSDSLAPIMLLFVNMYFLSNFQCLISDMKEPLYNLGDLNGDIPENILL